MLFQMPSSYVFHMIVFGISSLVRLFYSDDATTTQQDIETQVAEYMMKSLQREEYETHDLGDFEFPDEFSGF